MRCLFLQPSLPQAVNSFHGSQLPCTFWKSIPFLWKQAGCQGNGDRREAGCAARFWHARGMDAGSPMDASPKMLGMSQATRVAPAPSGFLPLNLFVARWRTRTSPAQLRYSFPRHGLVLMACFGTGAAAVALGMGNSLGFGDSVP